MRRGSFRDDTVDYAAVGATQASDLMHFPPERSRPAEREIRLGSGEARFRSAGDQLLGWEVLTGAGLTLGDVRPAAGPSYAGVGFDESGAAVSPSRTDEDHRYTAAGVPFASAGASVNVHGRVGGASADAHLRVILVTDEPRRIGFALGTVSGSVVSGEELFVVEWRHNDEVWFIVRAFDAPASALYRTFPFLIGRRRKALFDRYLRVLSPQFQAPA